MVIRCADLVPVFFDIYGDTLCRSCFCILRYASVPCSVFCRQRLTFQDRSPFQSGRPDRFHTPHVFSCRLETSARGRWHRMPGCCGGGVITSKTWAARDGVIAASGSPVSKTQKPQASSGPAAMLLAVSRSPSSIPRRSPCPERCHLPLASLNHIHTHKKSPASSYSKDTGLLSVIYKLEMRLELTTPSLRVKCSTD